MKSSIFIKLYCISSFLLLQYSSYSQLNLIPFGDLEMTESECVEFLDQPTGGGAFIDHLPGNHWVSWHHYTVDVWTDCISHKDFQPPLTSAGFQYPQSGTAYGGFVFFVEVIRKRLTGEKREYGHELVGIHLKEELEKDSIYFFQGYFSIADAKKPDIWNCPRLDFLFHADSLKTNFIPPDTDPELFYYPNANPVRIETPHFNTEDWIKISFLYTAKGGEKFLSFGQIWNDSSDIPICTPAPKVIADTILATHSYILFDNLSLTKGVPKLDLELPNVFTPNGDGINDTYAFHLEGVYDEINYQIFNRWGEQVYQGNGFSNPWDGTHLNGNPCEEGVYFVKVNAKERYGIWKENTGFVHLVR